MAEAVSKFSISFRALLSEAVKALEWPEPIYSHADLELQQANLVLLRGAGPTACFFRGNKGVNMSESEEHAAEQAIDYLVQKNQIVIPQTSGTRESTRVN